MEITGTMVIDLVTSLLGLTCVVLAGRNSKYNFWVGYLYTVSLFVLFYKQNLMACLLLQPVSFSINVLGHYRWTHPRDGERSSKDANALKVSKLTWLERGLLAVSVLVVAFGWGWLLDSLYPSDPHPYLDSCVTVLILSAQLMSALKKWECWTMWILVNVSQIALHLSVGNVFMPVVCGLYLINGIVSLVHWEKLFEKKA